HVRLRRRRADRAGPRRGRHAASQAVRAGAVARYRARAARRACASTAARARARVTTAAGVSHFAAAHVASRTARALRTPPGLRVDRITVVSHLPTGVEEKGL